MRPFLRIVLETAGGALWPPAVESSMTNPSMPLVGPEPVARFSIACASITEDTMGRKRGRRSDVSATSGAPEAAKNLRGEKWA